MNVCGETRLTENRSLFSTTITLRQMTPLEDAYHRLFNAYGPQHWWPAQSRFEVMIGAVLVQHSAWRNVERAIAALNAARLFEPKLLAACSEYELAELIRPAGTPSVKARRLLALASHVVEQYDGSIDRMFSDIANSDRLDNVRNELLSVHGIGPETADAILLYAGSAQTFVIDAYARRVLSRHGWAIAGASYAKLKAWCESQLPQNVQIYNEFHALLVHVGREHCRSRTPSCEGCPLQPLLPNSGPISDRVAS